MSEYQRELLEQLDKLYEDALRAIVAGNMRQGLRVLERPYGPDELLQLGDSNDAWEFADALTAIAGCDDVESAVHILTDGRVQTRECQLHLLKAFAALSSREPQLFIQALGDLCNSAAFLGWDDAVADHIVRVAMAFPDASGLGTIRLSLWSAKRYVAKKEWRTAWSWLQNIDPSCAGPFEASARAVIQEVAKYLDVPDDA